ncbi:MAG: response regulator [Bacteroidetes bacterium]|nr:MAG: response regulator [Bacteroidota bacterium]
MSITILLIEDNLSLLENASEIFELEGYKVLTATNGRKGIELLTKYVPDVIICDVMMSEIDGHGVLTYVRSNPEIAHIPFVFLSAQSEKADIQKGMQNGANAFLTKPFESDELLKIIKQQLMKIAAL